MAEHAHRRNPPRLWPPIVGGVLGGLIARPLVDE
jgi:hypothetical protein